MREAKIKPYENLSNMNFKWGQKYNMFIMPKYKICDWDNQYSMLPFNGNLKCLIKLKGCDQERTIPLFTNKSVWLKTGLDYEKLGGCLTRNRNCLSFTNTCLTLVLWWVWCCTCLKTHKSINRQNQSTTGKP
jgi:hypothetical protein